VDFEQLGEIRNNIEQVARVRLVDGRIREAEIHWYEAHGVGRTGFKIIRLFPETQ